MSGRLLSYSASDGQQIHYTLDLLGNRTQRLVLGSATGVPDPGFDVALDFDGNEIIDHADLARLRGAILAPDGSSCRGPQHDLNADGKIDRRDAFAWLERRPWHFPLSGDWVGTPSDPASSLWASPPDDAVDFFDLAALIVAWNDAEQLRELTQLSGTDARLADASLGELREAALEQLGHSWSASEVQPVGAVCGASESPYDSTPLTLETVDMGLVFDVSPEGDPAAHRVRVELRANDRLHVKCFQLFLSASQLEGSLEDLSLLDGGSSEQVFRRVESIEGGWLLSWGFLGEEGYVGEDHGILASFTLPVSRRAVVLRIADGKALDDEGQIRELARMEQAIITQDAPSRLTLARTYPNPFNPRVTIEFGVSHTANVRVDVYDLHGRRVRRLENSVLAAGWHHRIWDGTDDRGAGVSSGVYLVRVQDGETADAKRVVLVR